MGLVHSPAPVKLFVGVLASAAELFRDAEDQLAGIFGPVDMRSDSFPFDQTQYYDKEMGTPISRRFLGFARLIAPEDLAAIKLQTNRLEAEIAQRRTDVTRPVNLDPGYLEQSKIVLASTKNFYHRILLRDGIYAEVTLHYQGGKWQSLPWTFPDFRTGRYDEFFKNLRKEYQNQLKKQGSHL